MLNFITSRDTGSSSSSASIVVVATVRGAESPRSRTELPI
jgi:hypothetical protein